MHFKYIIIGAGVVGLAIARELSFHLKSDEELIVIEKEKIFGQGISSRNSEVIHSGLYYPANSLKHILCIEGRNKLYDYCIKKDIDHKKCGKLIIAHDKSEMSELEKLFQKGLRNKVENMEHVDEKSIFNLESNINAVSALFLRETGIVSAHQLMKSFLNDITNNNGEIVFNTNVENIELDGNIYKIVINDSERTEIYGDFVINSAGLDAFDISDQLFEHEEKLYPCKGTYFYYSGKHDCTHLVYPIPHKGLVGLGVHSTIDISGRLKFGPDAEYVNNKEDFIIDESKQDYFYSSASRIFNNIDKEKLYPDYVGMRPKMQGPDDTEIKDFYIKNEINRGFPNFINCLGIESPGLTSSMAIGSYVWEKCIKNI